VETDEYNWPYTVDKVNEWEILYPKKCCSLLLEEPAEIKVHITANCKPDLPFGDQLRPKQTGYSFEREPDVNAPGKFNRGPNYMSPHSPQSV
jgi:hypothetical protein